jgi:hypothetical protein
MGGRGTEAPRELLHGKHGGLVEVVGVSVSIVSVSIIVRQSEGKRCRLASKAF